MAENKFISQLTTITEPNLTGYTIYDDGNTTYKMALGELTAFVTADEGDFAITGSNIFRGSQTISGSLSVTGIQTVKDAVIIGPSGSRHISNPEILHVQNSGSYNVAHFTGNHPSYTQINLQNISSGSNASGDIVVTADNGTENVHYIDMGINSSTYTGGFVGLANDAYVINVGKDLYVGTVGGINHPANLKLFAQNSWEVPQISISGSGVVGFNTVNVSEGYQYEFSGSVNLLNNLDVTQNLTTNGFVVLSEVSSSLNFANDSEAEAGNVPLGGLYRSGSHILIRLT